MGAIVFLDVLFTSVYCTVFLYLQGSCINCVLLYQSCVDFFFSPPFSVTCGRLNASSTARTANVSPVQGLCKKEIKKNNF
uniref:Secreted protein n=1 Tax=Pyxicephalus adspersus TaxID=30357 RepID=A0AAV3AWF9_PYXAD|nr:TPA: hypothetical protein GDO54_007853 [Pyxicephalus adspersus]